MFHRVVAVNKISKVNETFPGYFDPKIFFIYNRTECFWGALTDIQALMYSVEVVGVLEHDACRFFLLNYLDKSETLQ